MQTKRLILVLMIAFCSNILGVKDKPTRAQNLTNHKIELVKSLFGAIGTVLCSYLSYKTTINNISKPNSNVIDRMDAWIYHNIFDKFLDLENNRTHQFIAYGSIPIIAGIAAFECAKYSASKFNDTIKH